MTTPSWRAFGAVLLLFSFQASGMASQALVPTSSPEIRVFPITAYGAVADGVTLNTDAIQKAIDVAAAAGGGVVRMPPGTFLSGSIFLKAGVQLCLDEGAILLGSTHIEDYPKRETRIEGHFEPWRMALVNAQGLTGVRIGGRGVLNGNGVPFWQAYWQRRKENPKCTNLEVERPRLVFIDRCQDVLIEGVSLQDSGFWNLHLYRCRDVRVQSLSITIPSAAKLNVHAPSTDGIDVDSSQNVTIDRCYISTNDDNIALKGSKGPQADRDGDSPPVENILIEGCEIGDGNGLITCGSEATIVRNVTARNCTLSGNATMLTLKLRPDTPQHYENITLDGIVLKGGGRLISVAPWMQFFDLKGQPPPSRQVNNVTIRNVTGRYGSFGILRGNPGDNLRDITFENVDVTLDNDRLRLGNPEALVLKNVKVNGQAYILPRVDAPKPVAPTL
ncbi:MAG TPA: glycosyl hydrolase family 28 protein [Lacunisphaera sp.]|nr:glycosyl hydrolase family 28 protein [Lacunisphaera sp.]